jgi:uncharacterized protein (UPF0333 family)
MLCYDMLCYAFLCCAGLFCIEVVLYSAAGAYASVSATASDVARAINSASACACYSASPIYNTKAYNRSLINQVRFENSYLQLIVVRWRRASGIQNGEKRNRIRG